MTHNKCHKRIALLVLAGGLMALRAAAWSVEQDLPREMADIGKRLTAPGSLPDKLAVARDLQNINYEISQAILSADSPDWGSPSPERQAIIERAANVIEPYNLLLVEMAFDENKSGLRDISRQCLSLLDYTRSDAQFQTAAERQALLDPGTTLQPFRLLYEHHALSESMRELASARIHEETDPRKKTSMALASAEMGFEDAIPVCEQFLSRPFTTDGMADSKGVPGENELTSGYRRAADAVLFLGPKAKPLLPLLVQRRDEIVRALGPEASGLFIGKLVSAIDCIEGRRPVNFPVAVNGSGRLDTIVSEQRAQGLAALQIQAHSRESFAFSAEDSRPPSRLPWAIVLVVLLVSGIGVLFRKTETGP